MSNYNVQLKGADKLIANLNRISAELRGMVALQAVDAGAQQIKSKAVMNAPVKTGNLRNSAIVQTSATLTGAKAIIKFQMEYARIQEFGGTVTAKNKPYLVFQVNGQWVKKKSVYINGKHYLQNAINSEQDLAVKAMGDAIAQYLR